MEPSTRKNAVVLIEDNPLVAEMYRSAFTECGCEVFIEHNGESGVKIIKKIMPDVVVLDLHMPGVDGFGVLREIRGDFATHHMKVVVLTVDESEESKKKAMELGATDYLLKSDYKPRDIVHKALGITCQVHGAK